MQEREREKENMDFQDESHLSSQVFVTLRYIHLKGKSEAEELLMKGEKEEKREEDWMQGMMTHLSMNSRIGRGGSRTSCSRTRERRERKVLIRT